MSFLIGSTLTMSQMSQSAIFTLSGVVHRKFPPYSTSYLQINIFHRQYQVSPSHVIRKPRNLLDWCSKYRVTHTFSPNFLLAQMCRDPTIVSLTSAPVDSSSPQNIDLSSLRVFVTGGEANPVKTAVEFSDLIEKFGAPRTTLRAAFGMTETGVRHNPLSFRDKETDSHF